MRVVINRTPRKVEIENQPQVRLIGENRDANGDIILSQTFPHLNMALIRKMYKFTASAGIKTFYDIEVTTELRISGGEMWVENPTAVRDDDYVEFSVVDKNDVLGYFPLFGYQIGINVLEIKKFVKTDYLKKNIANEGYSSYLPSDLHGDPVIPGLFFRIGIKSTGTSPIQIKTRLAYYEE